MTASATVGGPYFDELHVGDRFDQAPSVTLTDGMQSLHQAVTGTRLRLPLDHALATRVAGRPLASPSLVWDLAIGQSTVATQHVKANVFYRGLAFRRMPALGDTLRTVTSVVALRQNSPKPDRFPTGLAALRIETVDQHSRPVLDFWRCAMLPLSDENASTTHQDDLRAVGTPTSREALLQVVSGLDLAAYRERVASIERRGGDVYEVVGADLVSSAPELARLTLNIAAVHHDAERAGGTRLVYGGHTIGLAFAQVTRALPELVTVLGWQSCDHLNPVHEGDTLNTVVTVESVERTDVGARIAALRADVTARSGGGSPTEVLRWRFTGLLA